MVITNDTPIEKQIEFFEGKISQYLNVIKVNTKGTKECSIWISQIQGWNNEIIDLRNKLK